MKMNRVKFRAYENVLFHPIDFLIGYVYNMPIMKKMGVSLLAFLACLTLCANATQAVNAVPVPARKPDSNAQPVTKNSDELAAPIPEKKPVQKKKKSNHSSLEQPVLLKLVFEAQERGDIKLADKLLKDLEDETLLGHVLYQRYMHPTAYRSSFEELKYWLDIYADHPGASRIYKMAQARKPAEFSGVIKEPLKSKGVRVIRNVAVNNAKRYVSTAGRGAEQRKQYRTVRAQMRSHISKAKPGQALSVLNNNRNLMDKHEINLHKAEIARGYFYTGQMDKALRTAREAIKGSGTIAADAYWIAGLASWRAGNYSGAADYFKDAASSEYASGWMQAAGSFWAARSLMRAGDVTEVSSWLEKAHAHPRTFYGLLAMRALGRTDHFNWKMPNFTRDNYKILAQLPQGVRAMALVEADQPHRAEEELLTINIDGNPDLQQAMLAYAKFANLPRLSMRLGNRLSDTDNAKLYEAALYPMSDWTPTDGYQVDPSLVHAIIHQESKFNPRAQNGGSGASGLMQLMPATAKYTASKYGYGLSHPSQLLQPQINLDIGQLYLQHLLKNTLVQGNVIKLLVAYNAGPGNLKRWWNNVDHGNDPILFVEMIPVGETRAYIEHVLSNYWMYRLQNGQDLASLDALVEGQWAIYQPDEPYAVAQKN